MKRLLFALPILIASSACGSGIAPTLSEITLSNPSARLGSALYATVHASDPDGDLDRSEAKITVRSAAANAAHAIALEESVRIAGVAPGDGNPELIFMVLLSGKIDSGDYRLSIALTDDAGNRSPPAEISFALTGAGGTPILF
jgi:hypothetical protein